MKKLFLIGLGILISLFLVEILVRVLDFSRPPTPAEFKEQTIDYLPAVFARSVIKDEVRIIDSWFSSEGATFHINRFGYRGNEWETPKPSGKIRILVYGGSAVFDSSNDSEDAWPFRLQEELKKRGFNGVEVLNLGIPGHASFDSAGRLFAEGHIFEPDIVLIYNAWNDIKVFTEERPLLRAVSPQGIKLNPFRSHFNRFDGFFAENSVIYQILRMKFLLSKYDVGPEGIIRDRKGRTKPVNQTQLRQYELTMKTFVDTARNIGAVPVLLTQARLAHKDNKENDKKKINLNYVNLDHQQLLKAFELTEEIIFRVSKEKHTVVIDASASLSGSSYAFHDHVHMTKQGSRDLASVVADGLTPVLEKRL